MNRLIAILACSMAFSLSAKDMCLNVDDSNSMKVKVGVTEMSKISPMQKLLDEFIVAAKQSTTDKFDNKRLINKFSKFDASQSHLVKELAAIPDKFSLYGGIASAKISHSFDWGSYRIAVVDYAYQGQVAQEAQAFFCTNSGCRLSNIFERGKGPEDIALRLVHQLKFNKFKSDACPSNSATYSVLPTVNRIRGQNPIDVFVSFYPKKPTTNLANSEKEKADPDFKLKGIVGNFYRCVEMAREQDTDALYEDKSNLVVKSFLSNCTLNMDLGNMTPIVRGSTLTYLPPISLIDTLKDPSLKSIAVLKNNDVEYQVLGLVNDDKVGSLIVLPLVGDKIKRIDWKYFNQDISSLLLMPGLKKTVSTG